MACTYGLLVGALTKAVRFARIIQLTSKVIRILTHDIRYSPTKKLGGHCISTQVSEVLAEASWEIDGFCATNPIFSATFGPATT
jgi:hypothetical protein